MQDIQTLVGARLKSYRTYAGMSQEKLAEEAGVHPTYIGQIERGEKNLTLKSLAKICAALQVPLATLLEGVDTLSAPHQGENYPLLCYSLVEQENALRQKELYDILKSVCDYATS